MKRLIAILLLLGSVACGEIEIINTFTSGELSPHLDARIDFEKYSSGCRTLENFIVLPYGGAYKRPGTQYIANTKSNGVARLAPFSVGVDQTYIMEMGEEYIRFYRNGIQLLETNGLPLEVITPYQEEDVFAIQFAQFADTVYMVHPNHPVQRLQRTTTTPTFTIEEVEWTWPPVLDENLTDTTITPSATTGTITLTASDPIFTTNHVDSKWVIRSPRDENEVSITSTGTTTSDWLLVEGEWNFRSTGGINIGEYFEIQVSEDDGNTWGTFRKYEGQAVPGVNYDRDGEETEFGILYRLTGLVNDVDEEAFLKCEEPYQNGFVTITAYLTPTTVTATVESPLGSTDATDIWFEGAFSDERGHPRTVEFYENRLWFGGNEYNVNTLWGSKTDDYENFQTGTFDDSSLRLSINSDNIIEWLLGRTQLFVGTLGDEWVLSGGDTLTPVTPTSVLARRQTSFGSKDGIDALIASDSIMYLQRQGRKLREFEYSLEADAYKSTDVTLLAEHITEENIIQIAEQQQPEPIVWAVRGDGELIGMTYNKIQNVYGWHRHVTEGEFESVAVIPTTGEDRVYVVVNRENGRYIEWLRPIDWVDDDDAWFVDSGLDYDGGSSVSFTCDSVDDEGFLVLECTNSFSVGDYVELFDLNTNTYEEIAMLVTNATPTNITVFWRVDQESVIVSGTGTDVDHTYFLDGTFETRPVYRGDRDSVIFLSGMWQVKQISSPREDWTNSSTSYLPPQTSWSVGDKGSPAPTITYGDIPSFSGTVQRVQQTFTNVSHLAGQTLNVFADGGTQPDATVSTNGVLTLENYHNRVIAGLPYTASLSPMYIDVISQNMISYGKQKNPYKVHFRVHESGTFNYGSALDNMYPVSVRLPDLPAGQPVPFYSGDLITKPIDGEPKTDPEFWITSEEPLPLEMLSITIFTDVKEYE